MGIGCLLRRVEEAPDQPVAQEVSNPDPYNPQAHVNQVRETYDRTISSAMLARDAEYRKRVASVLSDLDRSSSSRRAAIGAGNPRLRLGVRLAFVESRPAPWESEE